MKTINQTIAERKQRQREKEIAATEAEQLWNNSTLQAAMSEIDEETLQQLDKAPIKGEKAAIEQQQVIMLRQVSNRFKKKLRQAIHDAAMAKRNSQP